MRVLVVEDDAPIRRLVRDGLHGQGLDVEEAATVEEAMGALNRGAPDLLILDLTLPDGSGIEILTHLRELGSSVHVIVLSGAIMERDRVRALELGADDYVVKPFFVRELTARVLAIQRRQQSTGPRMLKFDGLEIDLTARRAMVKGTAVELTAMEFGLLAFLAARSGHVFSRAELLRAVWRSEPEWQSAATVTEHIRRLRKKISLGPDGPTLLHTVSGSGYRFDAPPESSLPKRRHEPAMLTLLDEVVVDAEDSAAQLLGLPDAASLIGKHSNELIAADSLPALQERTALRDAGIAPRSQVLLMRDGGGGDDLAIEVSTSPVEWEGKAATLVEVRPAADESVRLRQLFTGVLSELTDAVIVTDMQSHIRSWNLAAERVYGWRQAEVLGRHILDVVAWGSDEALLASSRAQLDVTGRWYGEGHQLTRDGRTIAVRASTNVVRDETGEAIGIVSVNRPVDLDIVAPHVEPSASEIADLRRGIDAGELVVFYQPVVDLESLSVITVEALVRWRHPVRGLLAPDRFIDIAERSGMIVDVGAFVFSEAFRQVGGWRREGWEVNLAVNLSAKELADPTIVDRITTMAAAAGLDLRALWLEVTETALVEDVDAASALLYRLTDLGVGISIDDFGTGWASLTYLREFPVHVLKIDRTFVAGIDKDASSAAIARSILSLAAELELVVVAEGIEEQAEASALRRLGCSIGQGYLYGHPSAAVDIDLSHFRQSATPLAGGSAGPLPHVGDLRHDRRNRAPAIAAVVAAPVPHPTDVVGMLRALLEIRSTSAAAALVHGAVEQLGGAVVPAADAGPEAIVIDVSLGEGPPVFPSAPADSAAGEEIQAIIPPLVEDAKHAIALLRRHEGLSVEPFHDAVTGLANRRVLERVLCRLETGVVVIIELNRYDAADGADAGSLGDALVATFGGVLARSAGPTDLCCRVGRGEFVVVTSTPDVASAVELTERIRATWGQLRPEPVTLTAGAAAIGDRGGPAALLRADRALDRARALGPDHTEVDTSELEASS